MDPLPAGSMVLVHAATKIGQPNTEKCLSQLPKMTTLSSYRALNKFKITLKPKIKLCNNRTNLNTDNYA